MKFVAAILFVLFIFIGCGENENTSFEIRSDWNLTEADYDFIDEAIDIQVRCADSLMPGISRDFPLILFLLIEPGQEGVSGHAGITKLDGKNRVNIIIDRFPSAPHFECVLSHELGHAFYIIFGYGRTLNHTTNDFGECCPKQCIIDEHNYCESLQPFNS